MTEERNPTLRESLQETMATFTEPDGAPDETITEAAETETEAFDDGQDTSVEAQGSDGADDSGEQESTAGEDADSQGIQAPATWSEEDREAFTEMDDEAKGMLLAIHRNMEAGLTKGQTEVAELRKRYNAIDSFFESFQRTYLPEQEQEMVESAVMNALPTVLGYYMNLAKDPVNTLVELANTYNAKDALSEALSGLEYDDGTSEVRRENDRLRKQIEDLTFQQTKNESETAKEVIEVFKNQKTDDGVLKHPDFDEVRNTMHVLMSGDETLDLETAYEKALLIDKTDDVLSKKEEEIRQQMAEERKEKARTARKEPRRTTGKSGRSERAVSEEEVPKKLGDHLRAEMAKQLDDLEG